MAGSNVKWTQQELTPQC